MDSGECSAKKLHKINNVLVYIIPRHMMSFARNKKYNYIPRKREVRIATSRAQGANCQRTNNKGFPRDARKYTEAEEGCKFSGKTLPRVTREWGNSVIITRKERRLLGIAREKSQTTYPAIRLSSHSCFARQKGARHGKKGRSAQVNLPNCRCINQRS